MKRLFYGEKHSFIECIYAVNAVGAVGAYSNCFYVTDFKETYFEIYTKQVSCPLAFLF